MSSSLENIQVGDLVKIQKVRGDSLKSSGLRVCLMN